MHTATGSVSGGDTAPGAARLQLLDVLRGVAILGTLATNVWLFTHPTAEGGLISGTGGLTPLDAFLADPSPSTAVEGAFRFLANGKFLALLTILFGVGLAIQYRSAARRERRWPGAYRWRALFLLAEGALHFTLVFAWDVLMGYAVTGLVVAWLLSRSGTAQRVVLWAAGIAHLALMALLTAALATVPQAAAASDPRVEAELTALYAEGSYLEQIAFRLENALVLRLEPVLTFALMLFLFLLGVRLFRAGAFGADAQGRRVRARMAGWGLGLGLPLNLAAALGGDQLFLLDRYVAAPLVALGYIGLVGLVLDRLPRTGPVTGAVAALGRTAMTGYVLQNVLCVLACYGIGLGLTARLAGTGPWWVLGLWAAVSLVLLVAAPLWLRRFAHGPLEGLQKRVLSALNRS